MGIGLSLVARSAELHGGRARVTEREGGGACFHVLLPGCVKHLADDARPGLAVSTGQGLLRRVNRFCYARLLSDRAPLPVDGPWHAPPAGAGVVAPPRPAVPEVHPK